MLLRPDAIVASVTDVTPEFLQALEVRAVMVDLDDTLIASGSELLEPLFRAWLEQLVEAGFPVVILSNGARERVERWSRDLGVRGLALVGKPFHHAFRRGLKLLGSDPHDTAMVGDQLFTDVLGANLVGLKSVLVSPLSKGKLPHTRALRRLEKRLLRRFKPQGFKLRAPNALGTKTYRTYVTAKKPDKARGHLKNVSTYNVAGYAKRCVERRKETRSFVHKHLRRLGITTGGRVCRFSR